MQALSDEQRIDILEKKMDEGFARMDQSFAGIIIAMLTHF